MLHRPKAKTPRLKGDLPIFRRHYRSLFHVDPVESPDYYRLYLAWLRFCGVEPKTGKMTDKGLAVLKSFVEQETVKRGSRRRTGR